MNRSHKGKMHKPEDEDEKLDEALADTFPASDPPSQTDPNKRIGRTRTAEKKSQRKSD